MQMLSKDCSTKRELSQSIAEKTRILFENHRKNTNFIKELQNKHTFHQRVLKKSPLPDKESQKMCFLLKDRKKNP